MDYITWKLRNPAAADNLTNVVEKAIYERLPHAETFQRYPSKKGRKYPYYRITVKNFTVFYVVIGDVMEVRRIMYSRRNIDVEL